MSASERLKALAGPYSADWDSGPYGIDENNSAYALLAALPQLLAVVEAAQIVSYEFGPTIGEYPEGIELRAALTALEEALS